MKKYIFVLAFLILIVLPFVSSIESANEKRLVDRIVNLDTAVIQSFLNLFDTPSSYVGEGGQCVVVNAGETGLEFANCSNVTGGGGSGDITSVLGDTWITNGSVTGPVNLIFNFTKLQEQTLNRTEGDNLYLNLSGTNANQDINISPFNLELQNITPRDRIFLGGEDHWLKRGAEEIFDGISTQTFWFHHNEEHAGGTIGFLVTAFSQNQNRTMILAQVGRNNSAGVLGNSWMIIPNNLTENLTVLSDCFLVAEELDKTLRIKCDTSETGADLLVQDDIQAFGKMFVDDGIRSVGDADFFLQGNDMDVFNGSLHVRTPRIELTGFAAGERTTLMDADFNGGTLSPFIRITDTPNINEWLVVSDVACVDDECARAGGGSGSPERIMEVNFSSAGFNDLILNFTFTILETEAFDAFNVTINNNSGSGEIQIFSTFNPDADNITTISLPVTMNNLSVISLNMLFNANNPINEEVFLDNVFVTGNSTVSTQLNVTRLDTEFLLGNGDFRIFWNDTSKRLELPGNVTFTDVEEQNLNITGSITLGGETISNWDNISTFDDNVLLTNGSRPLVGNWEAGPFNITLGVGGWFFGLFNWGIGTGGDYLSFNGSTLNLNVTKLNEDFNETQIILDSNSSWTSTFNATYDSASVTLNDGLFINYTRTTTTGNISNGSLSGYAAANAICDVEVASGSHMCTMGELINTINNNITNQNFTATFRISEGAPGFVADVNDCAGWTIASGTARGAIWVGSQSHANTYGAGGLTGCNNGRAIACCA